MKTKTHVRKKNTSGCENSLRETCSNNLEINHLTPRRKILLKLSKKKEVVLDLLSNSK